MSELSALRGATRFMRGNILVLTVTQVLGMFGRSMAFPYASLYILALGGEPAQIGLVNALSPMAGLIMFPFGGYLADRTGRVKLIGMAGYLSGAIVLMYAIAPSWQFVALAALLQGFMVIQFPPTSAIIADSLNPRDRGRGIAAMTTASSAFAMFSPYLAGLLLDSVSVDPGMRYLYGFLALVYFAGATINLRFLKETSPCSQTRLALKDLPAILKRAYAEIPSTLTHLPRPLRALAVVVVLGFMVNAIAGPFWVVYAAEHVGLSSSEWGLILLVEMALRTVLYFPAGMVVDRWGRTRCIILSLLLCLGSIPFFPFASGFLAVLVIRAFVALANALSMPACSALMADYVPRDKRGRVMAALGRGTVMLGAAAGGTGGPGLGFVVTVPLVIASFASGYIYDLNPTYPWLFAAIAVLVSLVVSLIFIRDPEEAQV